MLTHGELPCPACGYQRRGLAHSLACPECGARGFAGELVVSGMPTETPEAKLGDRIWSLFHLVLGVQALLLAIWWGATPWSSDRMFTRVRAILLIAVLALLLAGWLRRRRQKRSGLSLERCVWEFGDDAVTVREDAKEARIPYDDIAEVSVQIDFVKRHTRVTLVTRGQSLGSVGLPALILHGSLDLQRAIVTEMRQRTKR